MSQQETVTYLRKAGRLDEALSLARQMLEAQPGEVQRLQELAWVHYAFIKAYPDDPQRVLPHLQELVVLKLAWEGEQMLVRSLAWAIVKAGHNWVRNKWWTQTGDILALVMHVQLLPAPTYCPRAALLQLALKIASQWDLFEAFVYWWNPEWLKPDDYQPVQVPGRKQALPPLAERLYIALAKRLLVPPYHEDMMRDRVAQLQAISNKYPHFQYTRWYAGKLLLALGDTESARKDLLPFLSKNQKAFWAWQILAETWRESDPQKALQAYCKAITLSRDESFLVRLREDLAALLFSMGNDAAAKAEVLRLTQTRLDQGWRLPGRVIDWLQMPGFEAMPSQALPYALHAKETMNWLGKASQAAGREPKQDQAKEKVDTGETSGGLVRCIAVISGLQPERKRAFWVGEGERHGILPGHIHPGDLEIGQAVELELHADGERWKVSRSKVWPGTLPAGLKKELTGKLRPGKNQRYAFVEDIYIGENLLPKDTDGRWKAIAIRSYHPAKQQLVWKAIELKKESSSG